MLITKSCQVKKENVSISFTLTSLIPAVFVRLTQGSQQQSRDRILQGVRNHRRAQALPQQAHDAQGKTKQSNQHHALRPFVAVAEAEQNAHHYQRDPSAAQQIA